MKATQKRILPAVASRQFRRSLNNSPKAATKDWGTCGKQDGDRGKSEEATNP